MVREKSARWPCSKDCDHQCIGNEKPHNHRAVKLISPNKLAFLVPWVSWPWDMQSRSCYFIICQPIRINKYLIAHPQALFRPLFDLFFEYRLQVCTMIVQCIVLQSDLAVPFKCVCLQSDTVYIYSKPDIWWLSSLMRC